MAPIIEVRNLSKQYRLGHSVRHEETAREIIMQALRTPFQKEKTKRAASDDYFWALNDLNFQVAEGEIVGIIGRNGAGKSTLLKILSRITDPSAGEVVLRGRMASLLEVGTGFHPELTGRENIFLNGALLGMRHAEIKAKFDEIVAFAEVEKFLDTPVKHYSSGMYVRLAFAVAAHLEPEVLVVDEVLAVGDMAFQKKCLGKMSDVSKSGRTVLFVSHNMAAVENLCQRGLLLEHGKLVFDGDVKSAVGQYLVSAAKGKSADGNQIDLQDAQGRNPRFEALLRRVELFTDDDIPVLAGVTIGSRLKLKIHFELPRETENFNIGIGFNNMYGQRVLTLHSSFEPERALEPHVGAQTFVCDVPSLTLVPGEYSTFMWLDIGGVKADAIEEAVRISVLDCDYYGTGRVPWNGTFVLPHRWELQPATMASYAGEWRS